MKHFNNFILPDFISLYTTGGPYFNTSIIRSISGREVRYSNLCESFQKYTATGCYLNAVQLEKFNAFFRNTKGAANGFCMKDHSDFQVKNQALSPEDETPNIIQLFKEYSFNEQKYLRRIFKPIPSTVQVFIDDCEVIEHEVDYNEGIIELKNSLHESQNLKVSFDFYVPVRFKEDYFNYSFCKDGSILLDNIELIEVVL